MGGEWIFAVRVAEGDWDRLDPSELPEYQSTLLRLEGEAKRFGEVFAPGEREEGNVFARFTYDCERHSKTHHWELLWNPLKITAPHHSNLHNRCSHPADFLAFSLRVQELLCLEFPQCFTLEVDDDEKYRVLGGKADPKCWKWAPFEDASKYRREMAREYKEGLRFIVEALYRGARNELFKEGMVGVASGLGERPRQWPMISEEAELITKGIAYLWEAYPCKPLVVVPLCELLGSCVTRGLLPPPGFLRLKEFALRARRSQFPCSQQAADEATAALALDAGIEPEVGMRVCGRMWCQSLESYIECECEREKHYYCSEECLKSHATCLFP